MGGFNWGAFAGGVAQGLETGFKRQQEQQKIDMAEKARQDAEKRLDQGQKNWEKEFELKNKTFQETVRQHNLAAHQSAMTSFTAIQKSIADITKMSGESQVKEASILSNDKLSPQQKSIEINALRESTQNNISAQMQVVGTQSGALNEGMQKMVMPQLQRIQQVGSKGRVGSASIYGTDGSQSDYLVSADQAQLISQNPKAFMYNDKDGKVYSVGSEGQIGEELFVPIQTKMMSQESIGKIDQATLDLKSASFAQKQADLLNNVPESNKQMLLAKKAENEIKNAGGNVNKIKAEIAREDQDHIEMKKTTGKAIEEISKLDPAKDYTAYKENEEIIFDNLTASHPNFDSNKDAKYTSLALTNISDKTLSNKLDSTFYRKNQDGNLTFRPEALSEILPMLKTEKSIESGGRVTKWWVNENLNIMGRMLSSQSELIAAGKWKPLYGSLKSLKLELEDTEGSAVVKKELIESQLEPLIAGYEGHSYDLYKNQWDSAIKHFDKSDKTGFFKGLPLLGKENNGFDDVKDAMDSLYLHIQNKYGDIIGTAKAVFSGDETNSKRLMSDVFPKIQIAYKALHPNEPLLAPMDFVSMMLNDYKADTNKTATVLGKTVINPGVVLDWGDTSSKRWYNSELYKVLLKTSQIKYD